jgi:hypothetical protein
MSRQYMQLIEICLNVLQNMIFIHFVQKKIVFFKLLFI